MFYERKEIRSLRKKTKPGIYGLHRKLLIRCYCSASADATHLPTNTYMSVGRSMKEKEGRQAYIVMALIWDTRIIRYLDCNQCWNEPKKSELRTSELWQIRTSNTSNLSQKIQVELELQQSNFELLKSVKNLDFETTQIFFSIIHQFKDFIPNFLQSIKKLK